MESVELPSGQRKQEKVNQPGDQGGDQGSPGNLAEILVMENESAKQAKTEINGNQDFGIKQKQGLAMGVDGEQQRDQPDDFEQCGDRIFNFHASPSQLHR